MKKSLTMRWMDEDDGGLETRATAMSFLPSQASHWSALIEVKMKA